MCHTYTHLQCCSQGGCYHNVLAFATAGRYMLCALTSLTNLEGCAQGIVAGHGTHGRRVGEARVHLQGCCQHGRRIDGLLDARLRDNRNSHLHVAVGCSCLDDAGCASGRCTTSMGSLYIALIDTGAKYSNGAVVLAHDFSPAPRGSRQSVRWCRYRSA